MSTPCVIITAPASGSGKTTVTAGLIGALRSRGLRVAPFKVGPDYIDPSYHAVAAGRDCLNLDGWLLDEDALLQSYARATSNADIAVIEGVMGLFDGVAGDDDTGSAAHIARLLGAPVIVVLDAQAMARTAAALLQGLRDFDPRLAVAGVIFNRVGSSAHADMLRDAVTQTSSIRVLGHVLRDDALHLPERHLGLIPTNEREISAWLAEVRARIEATVDVEKVLALASSYTCKSPVMHTRPPVVQPDARAPTIAVARDEAFSFIYPANLALLEEAGARVAFFSPLHEDDLPPNTHALMLCGGFPELYASQLSANQAMRAAIARSAASGMPIYAECGGLMVLTEALVDQSGATHPMCGVFRGQSTMTPRLKMGYRSARARDDSWLWHAGEEIRAHEFHYSEWQRCNDVNPPVYDVLPSRYQASTRTDGARIYNVIASYMHIHFLSMPELAQRFARAARAWRDDDQHTHRQHNTGDL